MMLSLNGSKGKNFAEIDEVKREIIALYKDAFFKIDGTGLIGRMYASIPTQLAIDKKIMLYLLEPGKRKLTRTLNGCMTLLIQRR